MTHRPLTTRWTVTLCRRAVARLPAHVIADVRSLDDVRGLYIGMSIRVCYGSLPFACGDAGQSLKGSEWRTS